MAGVIVAITHTKVISNVSGSAGGLGVLNSAVTLADCVVCRAWPRRKGSSLQAGPLHLSARSLVCGCFPKGM
jgi:hypothetical protein